MHTYKAIAKDKKTVWQVGYYTMEVNVSIYQEQQDYVSSDWTSVKTFKNEIQAAAYVNFLNGGELHFTILEDLLKTAID